MFVVTVYFDVHVDHVEEFRKAVLTQADNTLKKERQCRKFDVCFDPDEPSRCFLYEQYDNRAAFQEHLESSHFTEFDKTVADWVADKSVHCFNLANRS